MNYRSLFDDLARPTPVIAPAPSVVLRPYQRDAVDAVYREWESGRQSTLVVMPTGTGKSVVFSDVMSRHVEGRILVMAHRAELIYQAVGHAKRAHLTAGIEMGSERAGHEDVIVTSVQTLCAVSKCRSCRGEGCEVCLHRGKVRRMTRFNPHDFGLLVVDEGHHATAATYRMVLHWFSRNPNLRILFVTATPNRADGIGLHNVVDTVAYEMDLRTAIADGWLCPIRQRFVTVESLDLSKVGTKAGGDLADGDLARAMLGESDEDEQRMLHSIAKPTIDEAKGRPGLVFTPTCDYAEKLTAAFNAYAGVSAECVIQSTDREERKRITDRYQRHETQFLIGVGVFTEGYDAPATEVVAIARPTKSESLYLQMIGRGTRPLPGTVDGPESATERLAAIAASAKPACIVLDFVGNSGRHRLVSVADVLAGEDVEAIDLDAAIADAKRQDAPVDMEALIEQAKQRREKKEREREERRRAVSSHRAESAQYTAEDVDLFKGDKFGFLESYEPSPMQASAAQVKFLVKLGVKPETAMAYSKRQAGKVLDELTKRTGANFIVPFGKHMGKRLGDLPPDYIVWMQSNIGNPKVQAAIREMKSLPKVDADAPF